MILAEWIATLLGFAYVILMARHNALAWMASGVSVSIYLVIFWQDRLPMQAVLHSIYLMLSIIGWLRWQAPQALPHIQHMSVQHHLITLSGIGFSTLLCGWLLSQYALSQQPWLEAFTTLGALTTTILAIQKWLENWLYWIMIDSISAYLFWQTQHYPLVILYLSYLILAIYGYQRWLVRYRQQNSTAVPTNG